MIKSSKRIEIPAKERRFILPKSRQKMFKAIYSGYSKYFPMKLVYAYLNSDPELLIDYCVIYSARNDDDTGDLILFDVPPIHSDRSTPGFRYCKRIGKEKQFFEYGVDDMVIMDKDRFYEFIVLKLGFSKNKDDDNYWKKPENYKELLQDLLDMSLRYTKKI